MIQNLPISSSFYFVTFCFCQKPFQECEFAKLYDHQETIIEAISLIKSCTKLQNSAGLEPKKLTLCDG